VTAPISSKLRLWRFAAIGLGILWVFWLAFEDASERMVTFFALAICALIAARVLLSPFACKYRLSKANTDQNHPRIIKRYLFYAMLGGFVGIGVTVVGLLLMAFKTGLHGHATADYTPDQVIALVQLTPIYVSGSILISLGFALWQTDQD
jgi:hypothetical protein